MIPQSPHQIRLSWKDRRVLAWSKKPVRRFEQIPKYSTLPRVDRRLIQCYSCNTIFPNIELLKRHAKLTHTGTKPVVCEICEKRFSTERQMLSHYHIHNEPRLEEFNVLTRRTKKVRSLPTSFTTTVGSFRGVSKALKTYVSEPTCKSFGTRQSFIVSDKNEDVESTEEQTDRKLFNYKEGGDTDIKGFMNRNQNGDDESFKMRSPKTSQARRVVFSATTKQYSDGSIDVIRKVHEAPHSPRSKNRFSRDQNVKKIHVSSAKLPYLSPTRRLIEEHQPNELSEGNTFLPSTSGTNVSYKESSIDEVISRVDRSPKSKHTKSSYSEAHRQLYSRSSLFWDDPGYNKSGHTRRMPGVTSTSGYDPITFQEYSPKNQL